MKTIKILFLFAIMSATFVACTKEDTQTNSEELLLMEQQTYGETETPSDGKD